MSYILQIGGLILMVAGAILIYLKFIRKNPKLPFSPPTTGTGPTPPVESPDPWAEAKRRILEKYWKEVLEEQERIKKEQNPPPQ